MERKYYFRGLGLGIAITAVIMGIALSDNRSMTNDEIIARAKELGMVENTVLADTGNAEAPQENMGSSDVVGQDITGDQSQDTETPGKNGTQTGIHDDVADGDSDGVTDAGATDVQPADSSDAGEDEKVASTPDDDETGETENEKPETTEVSIPSSTVRVITINRGEGSYTVAKKLADVGVVASAGNFDTFLCENGYDKRLRTGSFSIPADASDEQIARIITGAE